MARHSMLAFCACLYSVQAGKPYVGSQFSLALRLNMLRWA